MLNVPLIFLKHLSALSVLELMNKDNDVIGYNCDDQYAEYIQEEGEDSWWNVLNEMADRFDVEIRESPVHGFGVFAKKDLPRGHIAGMYWGEVISELTHEERVAFGNNKMMSTSLYLSRDKGRIFIDGFNWSVGTYFNSVGGNNKDFPNPTDANALYEEDLDRLKEVEGVPNKYLVTEKEACDERLVTIRLTKPVKKRFVCVYNTQGKEIFVYYGNTFGLLPTNIIDIDEFVQQSQTIISMQSV